MSRHPLVRNPNYPDLWTAVYRLFDAAGRLLYVGIGYDYLRRWKAHAKSKTWWPQVARRDVTWYDNRLDAAWEETRAITTEDPLHNDHPGLDPLGLIVIRQRDRYGRSRRIDEPFMTTGVAACDRILDELGSSHAHVLVAHEGEVGGAIVPMDWYRDAVAAMQCQADA